MGGVRGTAAAVVALLAVAFAASASAAQPRLVDKSRRKVLRSGVLRVQVVADRPGAVRVTARHGRTIVGRRTVRFRRPGSRTVRLKLTERGRAAVEKCRGGAITLAVDGKRALALAAGGRRAVGRLRADTGACSPNRPAVSRPFELRPTTLSPQPPVVAGSVATVRAIYPDPGPETLMAMPRLAATGRALLEVTSPDSSKDRLYARADAERFAYVAQVPAGSTVRVLSVTDGCANSST